MVPEILRAPKTLREKQNLFAYCVGELLLYAYTIQGHTLTLGDAAATVGHRKNSCHYIRLAIDLNLFVDGDYQEASEAHKELGAFWKSLHPLCRWGGDFKSPDGNHYSITHEGRA